MTIYDSNDGCVYLTIYKGKLLPPYYIGSTYKEKILKENYHGTVVSKKYKQIWKEEIKTHPEFFETFIILDKISRKKAIKIEAQLQREYNVVESSLFINKSYADIGFDMTDQHHTEESKQKISISNKNKSKSKEHCNNISKGKIGKSRKIKKYTCRYCSHIGEKHWEEQHLNKCKQNPNFIKKPRKKHIFKQYNKTKRMILVLSPDGIFTYCYGTFTQYCKNNNLSYHVMLSILKLNKKSKNKKYLGYYCWFLDNLNFCIR